MSQIIDVLRKEDPDAALTLEVIALEYMRRRREPDGNPEDDDKLVNCELAFAGSDYLYWAADQGRPGVHTALPAPANWPFEIDKWKPRSVRFSLISAATYAVAELTRMIRNAK